MAKLVELLKFPSPVRWKVLFVEPCSPGPRARGERVPADAGVRREALEKAVLALDAPAHQLLHRGHGSLRLAYLSTRSGRMPSAAKKIDRRAGRRAVRFLGGCRLCPGRHRAGHEQSERKRQSGQNGGPQPQRGCQWDSSPRGRTRCKLLRSDATDNHPGVAPPRRHPGSTSCEQQVETGRDQPLAPLGGATHDIAMEPPIDHSDVTLSWPCSATSRATSM